MKIDIIGGGPAGLFFAYLMKRHDANHDIRVHERNAESTTYGWGVVFSDTALAFVRDAAPELYAALARRQVTFDDVAVVHQGTVVTLARNPFHRMARVALLETLHDACRRVGVELKFGQSVEDIDAFASADLIVGADGASSAVRSRFGEHFMPSLDQRPNWLAWFGTTRLFEALSLIFRQTDAGLLIAHCYQFNATHSTFLVEVDPVTFARAGLARMDEAQTLDFCGRVFAEDLQGHALLSNKSAWFKYTIVKNTRWFHRNLVLLGDALRTGHPSVGSGTRLALQDSIALFEACTACAGDVPASLAEFVRIRRPGSDALQEAAIRSTEWYEDVGRKLQLDPVSFAYDYLMRTGRVSHEQLRLRDPELVASYERVRAAVQA